MPRRSKPSLLYGQEGRPCRSRGKWMPIIKWNVDLLVGIQEIDQQHKYLVEILNRNYDEFREGTSLDPAFLQELAAFSSDHFACEEGWMKKTSYPKFSLHREEHDLFRSRISEFSKEQRGNPDISVELLWFLCNWVTHHIRETDAEFGRYVDLHKIRKSSAELASKATKKATV